MGGVEVKVIVVRNHFLGTAQYVCTAPNGPYILLSVSDPSCAGKARIITPDEELTGIASAIIRSYAGRGRKVELIDCPPHLIPASVTCDHVRGLAYVLNDGEGDAWVRRWMKVSDGPVDTGDWLKAFRYCPVCGKQMSIEPGAEDALFT